MLYHGLVRATRHPQCPSYMGPRSFLPLLINSSVSFVDRRRTKLRPSVASFRPLLPLFLTGPLSFLTPFRFKRPGPGYNFLPSHRSAADIPSRTPTVRCMRRYYPGHSVSHSTPVCDFRLSTSDLS